MNRISGRWVTDASHIESTARDMLAGNKRLPAVWVGHRGSDEPKVHLFTRDGQHQRIEYAPVDTFSSRLDQAIGINSESAPQIDHADIYARRKQQAAREPDSRPEQASQPPDPDEVYARRRQACTAEDE